MDQGTACDYSDLVELGVPSLVVVEEGGAGVDDADVALVIEVACVVAYVLTAPHRSETNAVVDAGSVPLSVPVG